MSSIRPSITLLSAILFTCGCGGGSNKTEPPAPTSVILSSISPVQTGAGSPALIVRGFGSGFSAGSLLEINGISLATQFVSSSEIDATIPANYLLSAGVDNISVIDSSLTTSGSPQTFTVTPPNVGNVQILVSVASDGTAGDSNSGPNAISFDGRFVAFASYASNLANGSSTSFANVYLRDTCANVAVGCSLETTLISNGYSGTIANGNSGENNLQVSSLSISSGGRYVVFESDASNLVSADTNGVGDIFLKDTCIGNSGCSPSTSLISVSTLGVQANGSSNNPAMSSNGRYIVFESQATNLVSGATTGIQQIYLRDTCTGSALPCTVSTILVSTGNSGLPANALSTEPSISADGRFVSFASRGTNLVPSVANGLSQIYLRDLCTGIPNCTPATTLVSQSTSAPAGGNASSSEPSISSTGRFIAFSTGASNIVPFGGIITGIAVRDTCLNTTPCSQSTILVPPPNVASVNATPSLNADGSLVGFYSAPNGGTGIAQVYVSRLCLITTATCTPSTTEVSTGVGGAAANFNVGLLSLSGDGHSITFSSGASNLVLASTNRNAQIFLAHTTF